MGLRERQILIQALQDVRGTKVVTSIYSDRRVPPGMPSLPALSTRLGTEAQPFLYKALQATGTHPRLDFFLYTLGGQLDSVWPLVGLFREFGDKFNVLVPFRCHSAGTLITLGANSIVMGEAAELSPVDPSTGNQFNPVDEIETTRRREISVEDVTAYFALAKDPGKIGDRTSQRMKPVDIDTAFTLLAEKVHPLALGNVNRSHIQIREVARRLLGLHRNTGSRRERKEIDTIVKRLTEERYSHSDILNRREARELLGGQVVQFANDDEQRLMWELFEQYSDSLKLTETFILANEMGEEQITQHRVIGAFIETEEVSYVFQAINEISLSSVFPQGYQVSLQQGELPPLVPGFPIRVDVKPLQQGWIENTEGL